MKKISILFVLTAFLACNTENKPTKANETPEPTPTTIKVETNTEIAPEATKTIAPFISEVLSNVKTLEKSDAQNPIVAFQNLAATQANKVVQISKESIATAFETAKTYTHIVITTGDHTLVKITDLSNCKQSGSWGACMPFSEGYIKKGALVYKEDYCNNIIGLPDAQERVMYLFE